MLSAHCRAGEIFALLLVDLDGFADVSERYGRRVGDLLLYEVSSRLREKLNEHDVVTRSGGNQFAILVKGVDRVELVQPLAQTLIERLQSPITIAGTRFRLSASIGISVSPRQSGEWRLLLNDADAAVHDAKTQGRGHVSITPHDADDGTPPR
jgi:diguanylate cyclase (GGDEF)-like protein